MVWRLPVGRYLLQCIAVALGVRTPLADWDCAIATVCLNCQWSCRTNCVGSTDGGPFAVANGIADCGESNDCHDLPVMQIGRVFSGAPLRLWVSICANCLGKRLKKRMQMTAQLFCENVCRLRRHRCRYEVFETRRPTTQKLTVNHRRRFSRTDLALVSFSPDRTSRWFGGRLSSSPALVWRT